MITHGHAARFLLCLFVLTSGVFLSGCGGLERGVEDRDPNIKRARERRAAGDYADALIFYQKALDKRPGLARIHWEMASIYDQHLLDELRAIYHYQRYLELDPEAERRKLVEELIGAARMSYAASLPARPSEAIQELARLKAENKELRTMLDSSREEVARLNAAEQERAYQPAATAYVEPPKPAPPQPAAADSYVVQSGDTLSRIAAKVYGDPNKWNVLFEANKHTLARPESVRVGQTLVVPR